MMKKQLFILAILVITLTLCLSGCGDGGEDLEGKYVATFELNGGTLDYGASNVNTRIYYAYEPGAYILDPAKIDGYRMYRDKYVFTGWYTSPECKPGEEWNFETKTIETETLTLYAGWEKAILHSYTVYYMNGEEAIKLGAYEVRAGEKFEDWRNYGNSRKNYTCIGYYSDSSCTQPWDANAKHPGGDTDCDVAVYAKYIEGEWQIVETYDQLKAAIGNGNIYLTADIDCNGGELYFDSFDAILEGNGHTVSNFTVPQKGTAVKPFSTLFKELGAQADIQNINFTSVIFQMLDVKASTDKVEVKPQFAALALDAIKGAKITNVTVSGKLQTNYTGELPRYNEAIYNTESTATITGFEATVTLEVQS